MKCANSLADIQWILKKTVRNGWMRSAKDADCFFMAGLTHDFYIGKLNGRRISSISSVWHDNSLAFGGCYFVDKSFRGNGYGVKTYQTVFTNNVLEACNVQNYVLTELQAQYLKNPWFQTGWSMRQYELTISTVREKLSACLFPSSIAKIIPASQANFEELNAYSADMVGSSQTCKSVLAAMLVHAQESSWVAIGNNGEMVGYLIMNKSTHPEGGYFIGPFFADSASIARILLRTAAEFGCHSRLLSLNASMSNPECIHILENELEAKPLLTALCVGTKGILRRAHEKIYGVASATVM